MDVKSSFEPKKKFKLTKRSDYNQLMRHSTRYVGKYVVLDVRSNQLARSRLGLTVVRRYGKAHERNRVKRLIREAFRLSYSQLSEGIDINIRPRHLAHFAKTQHIIDDLLYLIGNHGIAQPSTASSR